MFRIDGDVTVCAAAYARFVRPATLVFVLSEDTRDVYHRRYDVRVFCVYTTHAEQMYYTIYKSLITKRPYNIVFLRFSNGNTRAVVVCLGVLPATAEKKNKYRGQSCAARDGGPRRENKRENALRNMQIEKRFIYTGTRKGNKNINEVEEEKDDDDNSGRCRFILSRAVFYILNINRIYLFKRINPTTKMKFATRKSGEEATTRLSR